MPEIKIYIDNDEYSLECEPGEEMELKKAVAVVNEKMTVFKDQENIKKITKLVMVSLLLASESNKKSLLIETEKDKILKIENLIERLEHLIKAF